MYGIAEIIAMNKPEMIELIERSGGVRVHIKPEGLQKRVDRSRQAAMHRAGLTDEYGNKIKNHNPNRRW